MEVTPEKLVLIVIRPPELFSDVNSDAATGQKNKKKYVQPIPELKLTHTESPHRSPHRDRSFPHRSFVTDRQ